MEFLLDWMQLSNLIGVGGKNLWIALVKVIIFGIQILDLVDQFIAQLLFSSYWNWVAFLHFIAENSNFISTKIIVLGSF